MAALCMSQLRRTLADSHVAAVAIAMLLFRCLDNLYQTFGDHLLDALLFLLRWAITRVTPPVELNWFASYRNGPLQTDGLNFIVAIAFLMLAELLARWVYDERDSHESGLMFCFRKVAAIAKEKAACLNG